MQANGGGPSQPPLCPANCSGRGACLEPPTGSTAAYVCRCTLGEAARRRHSRLLAPSLAWLHDAGTILFLSPALAVRDDGASKSVERWRAHVLAGYGGPWCQGQQFTRTLHERGGFSSGWVKMEPGQWHFYTVQLSPAILQAIRKPG